MKNLYRILAIILAISMLPTFSAALADNTYYYEGFDGYVTNSSPAELALNTEKYYIKEHGEHNKALVVFGDKSAATLTVPVSITGSFVLSFDISCISNPVDGTLTFNDGSRSVDFLKLTSDNRINAYNGKHLFGYSKNNISTIGIAYDADYNTCDFYRNGKCVEKDFRLKTASLSGLSEIVLSFTPSNPGEGLIIDNIYAASGTRFPKKLPASEYNEEAQEEPEFTYGVKVGNRVIVNADFETPSIQQKVYKNGSTLDLFKETEENTVVLFERLSTGGFHLTAEGFGSDSDCIVVEHDLKILENESAFNFAFKDAKQNEHSYMILTKGGVLNFASTTEKLSLNKWYKISIIFNTYDRTVDYYINGEHRITGEMEPDFGVGCSVDLVRFHVRDNAEASIKFMVDNWKIYEGNELLENLDEVKNEIVLSGKTIFPSEASIIKSLSGYYAVHTRSGVAFANGTKTMLSAKPYEKDGEYYVDADELSKVFGIKTPLSGSVTIEKFADAANLKITKLSSDINSGAVIMGKSTFEVPDDARKVKDLTNYLFYLRPSPDEILARYNESDQKGVHPRICATKEDFERIKEQIKTNSYMKAWSEQIIRKADSLLNTEAVKYELEGVPPALLYVSRDVLENMHALGMAYQLTGEQKYVDRAWLDLKAVCVDFPDWDPAHALATGEMAAAVSLGYDWMYDAFTPEQRATIEEGIYQYAFYIVANAYQMSNATLSFYMTCEHNFNTIVNGGSMLAALALIDLYPEEAAFVVSSSLRSYEYNIVNFAPDGSYFEGARYWEFVMQYASKYMSTLDNIFGTTFAIESTEGLDVATDYMLYVQTSNGVYPYGDAGQQKIYVPEMLWLSYKYNKSDMASVLMDITQGKFSGAEDATLALLWYKPDDAASGELDMSIDKHYPRDPMVLMRESWNNDSGFVGIRGMAAGGYEHGHLDGGSFIYEYAGVRWAIDPGAANYNVGGYWDDSENGTRWQVYYTRAEAHNSLVVNPSDKPDHVVDAPAPLTVKSTKERGAIVELDTTKLHRDVQSARRGFLYTDNRKSLVIRDEINLTKSSDVYWFMQTNAKVTTDATGATLIQGGKRIRLDFVSNANATIEVVPSGPLPTSPVKDGDNYGKFNKIIIKATGSGTMNITVKLSPFDSAFTPVSDYDKSIDEWTVPDGAIPTAPKLTSLSVGGRTLDASSNFNTYNYVDGTLSAVPDIIAYSDQYDVTVEKGATLDDASKVIVTDRADPTNKATYIVSFNALTPPPQFDGYTSVPVMAVQASAEPELENGATNIMDAKLSTRWSAAGEGQWILLDLGDVKTINKAMIGFYSGDVRSTKFTIQVSTDGTTFQEVFTGQSSGTTTDYEFFDLGAVQARYVRFVGYGNTQNAWNSISEIVIAQNK